MSTVMIPWLTEFERQTPRVTLRIQGAHDHADLERNDVGLPCPLAANSRRACGWSR